VALFDTFSIAAPEIAFPRRRFAFPFPGNGQSATYALPDTAEYGPEYRRALSTWVKQCCEIGYAALQMLAGNTCRGDQTGVLLLAMALFLGSLAQKATFAIKIELLSFESSNACL
jgi:hypothetical protein